MSFGQPTRAGARAAALWCVLHPCRFAVLLAPRSPREVATRVQTRRCTSQTSEGRPAEYRHTLKITPVSRLVDQNIQQKALKAMCTCVRAHPWGWSSSLFPFPSGNSDALVEGISRHQ